jgi:hypothetical protein
VARIPIEERSYSPAPTARLVRKVRILLVLVVDVWDRDCFVCVSAAVAAITVLLERCTALLAHKPAVCWALVAWLACLTQGVGKQLACCWVQVEVLWELVVR